MQERREFLFAHTTDFNLLNFFLAQKSNFRDELLLNTGRSLAQQFPHTKATNSNRI